MIVMKVKYGFLGILIITLILTSTYPGVFLGLEWVWASNTVISTVDVGDGPSALAFNPSNNNIYVTNPVSDDVSVIQTTSSKPIVDAISDQSISISNLDLVVWKQYVDYDDSSIAYQYTCINLP